MKHAQLMEYDGFFDAVFTYRTEKETTAGTVWRFIMDRNKTVVVIPYQSLGAPAAVVHCVPERIESVLAGPWGMGDFGFAVHYAVQANVNNDARHWEGEIHEATEAELAKWKAEQKLPETAKREKAKANAHRRRAEYIDDERA